MSVLWGAKFVSHLSFTLCFLRHSGALWPRQELDGILCEQRQEVSGRGELQRQVTWQSNTFVKVRVGNRTVSCTAKSTTFILTVFGFNHQSD